MQMARLPVDEFSWDTAKHSAFTCAMGSFCSCHQLWFRIPFRFLLHGRTWLMFKTIARNVNVTFWHLRPRSSLCFSKSTQMISAASYMSIVGFDPRCSAERASFSSFCLSWPWSLGTAAGMPAQNSLKYIITNVKQYFQKGTFGIKFVLILSENCIAFGR